MANSDKPRGFIPVGMLDGSKIPEWVFPANAVSSNLFVGDLVSAQAAGDLDPSAAADAEIVVGAVTEIFDENMVPIGHPNSTVSTKYLPSADTGYAKVALFLPNAIFRVQADSGTAVAATAIFAVADHVAGTGSTTTAVSAHELDSSGITTGSAQLKIIGKVDEPGNDWAEHVDLLVVPGESFWFEGADGV